MYVMKINDLGAGSILNPELFQENFIKFGPVVSENKSFV
jgi:hypothetical protein